MIDASASSALAICDLCLRRELRSTKEEARAWLASHEANAHAGVYLARMNQQTATRRYNSSFVKG